MKSSLAHRVRTFFRALAVKIAVLALIFLLIPLILYHLFQSADVQQGQLLQRTVEEKGTLIASVLRPRLAAFQEETSERLQRALDELVAEGGNIRLLVRYDDGAGAGFLYVASAPAVTADYLEQERAEFIKLGVFDRLAPSCDGPAAPSVRFTNPDGRPELLTSVTPVHIGKSCWVVITSQAVEAILGSSIGEPVWRNSTVHIAGIIYVLGAVLVAWLFMDIWRSLAGFRNTARLIRNHGAGQVSFREMNTIPELTGVADDFDSLVAALKQSKDFIIQAAEENAHALKAPLAVIAQAIEPLKRATSASDHQAQRSLELIERSVARLDLLVSAARDLEEVAADVISANSRPIDLSGYLARLVAAFEPTLNAEGKHLASDISRGVQAYATEEAVESIIENLLENAASFTQSGGTVSVRLSLENRFAHVTIADSGPGVPEANLPLIFERHFSARSQTRDCEGPTDHHYGLGLWIVRRNVEGLGGRISARNRDEGGFAVTASLRAAG